VTTSTAASCADFTTCSNGGMAVCIRRARQRRDFPWPKAWEKILTTKYTKHTKADPK
jgi:hypothetical protein